MRTLTFNKRLRQFGLGTAYSLLALGLTVAGGAFFAPTLHAQKVRPLNTGLPAKANNEILEFQTVMRDVLNLGRDKAILALKQTLPFVGDGMRLKIIHGILETDPNLSLPIFKKYLMHGVNSRCVQSLPSQDLTWQIRVLCAIGIGFTGTTDEAINHRLRHLYYVEKHEVVKRSIVYAFGEIGNTNAVELIVRELEKTTDEASVIYGVDALAKIGNQKSLETLTKIALGKYLNITRRTAHAALKRINWSQPVASY